MWGLARTDIWGSFWGPPSTLQHSDERPSSTIASASDDLAATLSPLSDLSLNPFPSLSERELQLQHLLDDKEKQLQQAGALGQRVLAQQIELEEKIRHLRRGHRDGDDLDEGGDAEARRRYCELADTIKAWDLENAKLSSAFGPKSVEGTISASIPVNNPPRDEPARSTASSSSATQSRVRVAKNAAHRADDVEFAFEIGSGLLAEVRRLQNLLGERDKVIQGMEKEKDDLKTNIDSLRTALRSQEQSSDKLKEENWNLEVTLQELRTQLSDSQARESADPHKIEAERTKTACDEVNAKHDAELAQAWEHAAGLQRGKSDLRSALDALNATVAKANQRLGLKFGASLTPGEGDATALLTSDTADVDDVFTSGGAPTHKERQDTLTVLQLPLMDISDAVFKSWMLGDLTRVEDLLTEEIARPFHHPQALAHRALVRSRLERWDMAINDAKKSIEVQRSVFGCIANAIGHVGNGDHESAIRIFDLVFSSGLATENNFLLLIKALVLFQCGKHDDAISRVDDLIDIVGDDRSLYITVRAQMLLLLGGVSLSQGDSERAMKLLMRAWKAIPFQNDPHLVVISLIFGWDFDKLALAIRLHLQECITAMCGNVETMQ